MASGQCVFMKNRAFFNLWGNRWSTLEGNNDVFFVDVLSLPFHTVLETIPQPVPIKKKKFPNPKNSMKRSLKWLNTWQFSKSLRVFLVVFSRDQYWAQIYWKLSWMSGRLVLNPTDKIFSGTTISSALTTARARRLGDFGSLRQNKRKLCCLTGRNLGQAGKWETCPRKQWLKWMSGSFLHILPKRFFLVWPVVEAGWHHPAPSEECRRAGERKIKTKDPPLFVGSGKVFIEFEKHLSVDLSAGRLRDNLIRISEHLHRVKTAG